MTLSSSKTGNRTVRALTDLRFRDVTTQMSTCGYADGDPSRPRTAEPGFNCRVDISRGLWGFCPTTVVSASDCGLAAACADSAACSTGCGMIGVSDVTTFFCSDSDSSFCSTVLLDSGVDQTFSYIACGSEAKTETLLAVATTPITTTTTTDALRGACHQGVHQRPQARASNKPATSRTNTGAIIGGVIGGLSLVCGTVLAVVLLLRRGRRRRQEGQDAASDPTQHLLGKDSVTGGVTQPGYQGHLAELDGGSRPGEIAELG
ncbi:hypothetical protein F4779DRAFT_615489 [Xylariaceae sp. FL0662B]|nr:hypothetical protein F4779DRAFT_615489 [Xylariaceae sp. FL0662B]